MTISRPPGSELFSATAGERLPRGIFPRSRALLLAGFAMVAVQAQIIDATFNPGPNSSVQALAVQPDGKLLVGGSFTQIAGSSRGYFVRLNYDGSIDDTFDPRVVGSVTAIALQPDGRILLGGAITAAAGQPTSRLIRLHANGAVDSGFNAHVAGTIVRAVLVQPDGRIVVGGNLSSVDGTSRSGLARLASNGSLDAGFGADASGSVGSASPGVFALARQSDGAILLGGQFTTVAGQQRYGLARVRADGSLDPAFNPLTAFSSVSAITLDRDGKILLGGGSFVMATQTRHYLARLTANGALDAAFNPQPDDPVTEIVAQSDGRILIGGLFTFVANAAHGFFARLDADGSADSNLAANATGTLGTAQPGVNALANTIDGRIYLGGAFSSVAGQSRDGLARLIPPAPQILVSPQSTSAVIGGSVTFNCTVAGTSATYQWRKNGAPLPGATASTFTIAAVQPGDGGNYDVVAVNSLGSATSAAATLTIRIPPIVTAQPSNLTVAIGQPAVMAVSATGTPPPTYQWQKDGAPIAGATNATYAIAAAQPSDAGSYACVVSNSAATTISDRAVLAMLPGTRLSNVSVRTTLASTQMLIVGFVVGGGGTNVLVRAAGPALANFGVSTAMADPRLELYRESTKVIENNDWPGVLTPTMSAVGAFPFAANSQDAALLQSSTGSHSAVASGTGSGIVLVEIYDANTTGAGRLINVSARNRVGTDADRLIAGFTITGGGSKRILLRAVGPTLGTVPFNLPDTLVDPVLELYDVTGAKISGNDNWNPELASSFGSVGAFAFAPASKDAALVATLSPGSYTVQVSGAGNTTGIALVEVYEMP